MVNKFLKKRVLNLEIPITGLISYYKFENNLLDEKGLHNGTGTDITYVTGNIGQAVKFNDTSAKVDLNSNLIVGGRSEFSIACMIKVETFNTNNVVYGNFVDSKPILIRVGSTGGVDFFTNTPNGQVGGFFSTIPDTTNWHYLVCTYDGAVMKMYLNGIISGIVKAQTGALDITTFGTELIGADGRGNFGNCAIDSFAIYDRAIEQAEIDSNYTTLIGGNDLI